MKGKIISIVSMTALILSLAACGGAKTEKPEKTEISTKTPQPTEFIVTEAPTPRLTAVPTPRPTPVTSYKWKKYSYKETTNDGYQIEKYYSFTDKWISSSDESQIERICNELNIKNMPSAKNIGIKVNETEPQFYYIFGKVSCANITEGWDINEDNAKSVNYHIGMQLTDTKNNKNAIKLSSSAILRGFYSDGISQAYSRGGRFADDKNQLRSLGVKLSKNKSGVVPFVIAVYSQKNPNYPNGDDWYKELEIMVTDKSDYVNGHYEPEFKFIPSI